ncbi:MAG: PspC domain-containing protein [Flavobacteriaceae bacterium]|nr:PspC domain-containing protein [Flavobacteriaceae bacterium]
MEFLKYLVEKWAFDWFSFLGDRMGVSSRRIRLFFIYTSFAAIGSPVVLVAMMIDFWKNTTAYITRKKNRVWDL